MEVKLTDFIKTRELLSSNQVSAILRTYSNYDFKDAEVNINGKPTVNKKDRNVKGISLKPDCLTSIHWINFLRYRITNFVKDYCQLHELPLPKHLESINLLKYEKGGFYKPHVDYVPHNFKTVERSFSLIIFLNNDFKGGNLRFIYGNEFFDVKPYPGKAVIWPSNMLFKHCAMPVEEGTRYAFVSWMS